MTANLDPHFGAEPLLEGLGPVDLPGSLPGLPGAPRRRFGVLIPAVAQPGLILAVLVIALVLLFCFFPSAFT